ncbi:MAG: hypothetical protein ABIJ46_03995 [bacterium]
MEGERGRHFVVERGPQDDLSGYELREMERDISAFPEEMQPIIHNFVDGELPKGEDAKRFSEARRNWWYEKHGFPYGNSASRQEVLSREYASSESLAGARHLQNDLFLAFRSGDQKAIEAVQERYEAEYPDQLLGVTALFELVPLLEQNKKLEGRMQSYDRYLETVEECTQDQFLLTHFLAVNSGDRDFLRTFWDAAETLAKQSGFSNELNRLRLGILSQVAVFKTFESLGLKPKLSHPREDAFKATDLWTGEGEAIQVKGHYEGPVVATTENVSPTGVQVRGDDGELHFDSYMSNVMQAFRLKIEQYGRSIGRDIKGYLVQIPYNEFDGVTGKPTDEIIEFVRGELAKAGVGGLR